jgi:hypothetical protein
MRQGKAPPKLFDASRPIAAAPSPRLPGARSDELRAINARLIQTGKIVADALPVADATAGIDLRFVKA